MATAAKRSRTVRKVKTSRTAGKKTEPRAKKLIRKTVKAAARAGARSRARTSVPRGPLGAALQYFANSQERDVEYVRAAKDKGTPVVAMFCEHTPYEMILAAGAVVVGMHGGEQACLNTEATLPMTLCPWALSSLGHAFSGRSPLFEMADLVIADGACESKRRMQEMLSEHKPVHILDLPRGTASEGWYHWRVEVMKLRARLEKQFGGDVSDERLTEAIKTANHERAMLKAIFQLSRESGWLLDGEELATLLPGVRCVPENVKMLERTNRLLRRGIAEGTRRRRLYAPRVLIIGAPAGRGTTLISEAVHEAGGGTIPQNLYQGLPPMVERARSGSDPLDQVAEKHLDMPSSCSPTSSRRSLLVDSLVEHFQPDAAVMLQLEACGYASEDMVQTVESLEKSRVPVAVIHDDPASMDHHVLTERMSELLGRTTRRRRRRTA